MKSQSGFTLIEMVVVIVILAIMAATAMPRFTNLSGESRMATVAGMAGAMNSAKNLAKSKWVAANSGNLSAVDVGGVMVRVISTTDETGGVTAQGTPYAAGTSGLWAALDNPNGFVSAYNVTTSGLMIWPIGVTVSQGCTAYYSAGAVTFFISGNVPASCL